MEEKLKEKILKQLEKARKKLYSAERIFKDKLYEDSISRAYYAMFHATKALLLTKHIQVNTHSGAVAMLSMHFIKTGLLDASFGKMLSYAKDLRENGDYDTLYEATREEAETVLTDSKKFLAEIDKIIKKNL
ncbi:MAG: HEPN domain-containing protein [Candidatus Omnitrophica bacterium]|nr:HEPN domain-containing protein [Candidatus Omnitrophota bacterium]